MTIGVFATIKAREGQEAALEAGFKELAAAVRANEPGNSLYMLVRSRKEKGTYHVMEVYESEEALNAHRGSAHMKAIGPKLGPVVAGPPAVEIFDAV